MKRLLLIPIVLLPLFLFGQQDPIVSQYMFNPLIVNPAYAGSRKSLNVSMLHRSQWVGFDGAPTTQSFGIHSPLRKTNMAIGGMLINDRIGPVNTFGAFAVYSYKIRVGEGKLSFGLNGGIYNFRYDRGKIDYQDQLDPLGTTGVVSSVVPSFDFGTYYYTRTLYVGLNVSHLTRESFEIATTDGLESNTFLRRHISLTGGKAIELKKNLVLRPSFLLRTVGTALPNYDINCSVLIDKKLWLGASWRSSKNLVFIAELQLSNLLRFGYSYDLTLSTLRNHSSGSHELFIGFDFELVKHKAHSTRYF